MSENRICPDCRAEYLPHVTKCADCGAALVSFKEYEKAQDEKKRLMEQALASEVPVREGDLKWMGELYQVLIDSGIPCTVRSGAGCTNNCCGGDQCRLVVSPEDAERAQQRIEEYFMEMHPEARASSELASEGKCPACGSPVAPGDSECPDCGLMLVIIEKKEG